MPHADFPQQEAVHGQEIGGSVENLDRRKLLIQLCGEGFGEGASVEHVVRLTHPGVWRQRENRPASELKISIQGIGTLGRTSEVGVCITVQTVLERDNLAFFGLDFGTGQINVFRFFDRGLGALDSEQVGKGSDELGVWQTKLARGGVDEFLNDLTRALGHEGKGRIG